MADELERLAAQATYRRGALAVHGRPDPGRCALLVMNLQRAWLAPGAPFRAGPADFDAQAWLDRIHAMADWVRSGGGQVAWLRTTAVPPDSPRHWSAYYDAFIEPVKRAVTLQALQAGSDWHALDPRVRVADGDWVLDKHRFTAFVRNDFDLESLLQSRGLDTVIIAGTATNICCESTARDAMTRDLRVFMPHDLVIAPTPDGHQAGLRSVMQAFADLRPSGELVAPRRVPSSEKSFRREGTK